MPTSSLVVAVPAAVTGAALMGLASAAQARATKQVDRARTLDPALLSRLVRRPLWLAGIAATVAGLVLQLVALAFAPLLVVQPLLVTSLIFAGFFSARLEHRPPDAVLAAGSVLCVAGLAVFMVLARPGETGTTTFVSGPAPVALALTLAALTVAGLAVSVLASGAAAVLGLAVATGVLYGVTAGLMKVVAGQAREDLLAPFTHPVLYVVCVVGPMGFLLSQNTFQRGEFLTPALAVITALDPLVGVAIGLWWLGETATTDPAAITGAAVAGLVVLAGVVVLAARATRLTHETPEVR
ncbi:DMT family transporter [Amycolatopsis thermophila]|uniref:Drug/metabolite transporter (DMT)-like permease n=1 Tax=Amycolatopsis thermophila TaxID=206084 RepID=A0ABU0F2V3_9PSEU|nr:DMT family transporter [Amycolatopsis thermophila]MDQ0381728.1 drug/metabolite transporter (DMT)-like permease [Amycolatopsis thermophila]